MRKERVPRLHRRGVRCRHAHRLLVGFMSLALVPTQCRWRLGWPRPVNPLDHATRAYMEPRFGYDFTNVRVHTDD